MHNALLCLGTGYFEGLSEPEQIRLFKKIGFEGFFSNWAAGKEMDEIAKTAKEQNMIFQSIHAPFTKMADIWTDTPAADAAVEELIECVQVCARYDVPIMVVHAFIGFEDHSPNEHGLRNFGKVVEQAKRLSVKVAFENTEGEEYLEALMTHFADCENVGFCWDTGHEMCYNYSKDMMALYGDRLLCTHLNDNLGIRDYKGEITWIDDLHLLPFDGIADWQDITARMNRHRYDGILTFELSTGSKPGRHENDCYSYMKVTDYLTEVYKRACRVAALKLGNQKHI